MPIIRIRTPGRDMETIYFTADIRTSKFDETLVMTTVNHLMASIAAGSAAKIMISSRWLFRVSLIDRYYSLSIVIKKLKSLVYKNK